MAVLASRKSIESDRALRELFGAAYFPDRCAKASPPAASDRRLSPASLETFLMCWSLSGGAGVSPARHHAQDAPATPITAIDSYRGLIVGGQINWTSVWVKKLEEYVRNGGTVVLNAAQVKGLSDGLLGLRLQRRDRRSSQCALPLARRTASGSSRPDISLRKD